MPVGVWRAGRTLVTNVDVTASRENTTVGTMSAGLVGRVETPFALSRLAVCGGSVKKGPKPKSLEILGAESA